MIVNRPKRVFTGLAIVLIIIAGIYIYSSYNPEDYRFFPKCPVYSLTGYKCPGCGSQRAFYHLFHGNISAAFAYNPLAMLTLPYIFLGIYLAYIDGKTNPHMLRLRNLLFNKWAALVLAVLIAGYTILRNYSGWNVS